MRLEVGVEFFGGHLEGQSRLLETGILGFYLGLGLAYEEYGFRPLVLVFFE